MVTIIAETPDGPVETTMSDLSDERLSQWVRERHPAAIAEYTRRLLAAGGPNWLSRVSGRAGRRSGRAQP